LAATSHSACHLVYDTYVSSDIPLVVCLHGLLLDLRLSRGIVQTIADQAMLGSGISLGGNASLSAATRYFEHSGDIEHLHQRRRRRRLAKCHCSTLKGPETA
jgi:hypothetical protein